MDWLWGTSMSLPGEDARLMAFERALPGAIIVNANGERYMNEAASYDIAGQQMIACDADGARTDPLLDGVRCAVPRQLPGGAGDPDFPELDASGEHPGGALPARTRWSNSPSARSCRPSACRPPSRASTPRAPWDRS